MDGFYEFSGYFIPIRFNLSDPKKVFYVEIDQISWCDLIDEIKIYCKNNDCQIKVEPIKDDDYLHVNYYINSLLIGYKSYSYLGVLDEEIYL